MLFFFKDRWYFSLNPKTKTVFGIQILFIFTSRLIFHSKFHESVFMFFQFRFSVILLNYLFRQIQFPHLHYLHWSLTTETFCCLTSSKKKKKISQETFFSHRPGINSRVQKSISATARGKGPPRWKKKHMSVVDINCIFAFVSIIPMNKHRLTNFRFHFVTSMIGLLLAFAHTTSIRHSPPTYAKKGHKKECFSKTLD